MRRSTSAALAIALAMSAIAPIPTVSLAQPDVGVTVYQPPPSLPVYDQPPIPAYGYIWAPGYWDWDRGRGDYFWIPGAWVLPPDAGLLWTPAWWGWSQGAYILHPGYWAPHIGYYGGIDYGFGYTGDGYQGGYWRGGDFFYNQAVNNLRSVPVGNVYVRPVLGLPRIGRVGFSGGPGGVMARPTLAQLVAMRERHVPPTPEQWRHARMAAGDEGQMASINHGAPAIAATARATAFDQATRAAGVRGLFGAPLGLAPPPGYWPAWPTYATWPAPPRRPPAPTVTPAASGQHPPAAVPRPRAPPRTP